MSVRRKVTVPVGRREGRAETGSGEGTTAASARLSGAVCPVACRSISSASWRVVSEGFSPSSSSSRCSSSRYWRNAAVGCPAAASRSGPDGLPPAAGRHSRRGGHSRGRDRGRRSGPATRPTREAQAEIGFPQACTFGQAPRLVVTREQLAGIQFLGHRRGRGCVSSCCRPRPLLSLPRTRPHPC